MEKDFRFGFHQQLHQSSPNLNSLHIPFDTGRSNTGPVLMNPCSTEDFMLRTAPLFAVSQFEQSRVSELYDSQNGFYHIPNIYHTFVPAMDAAPKEKVLSLTGPFDFGQCRGLTTTGTDQSPKRFLVFDQSGDKTTLIYSSRVQPLVEHGTNWTVNPLTTYISSKEDPKGSIHPSRSRTSDENIDYNLRDVTKDELHEDTEELNALLCSDSDSDFSVDDEETSTGHSPSSMTDNGIHDVAQESETGEEVDSLVGPTKRQKLLDGGYMQYERDTASSLKSFMPSSLEDNSEFLHGNCSKVSNEELGSSVGNKRMRKEKMHKTLSVLQSVIPNVNGKEAIVVIDEAICYLKSLKVEAETLGLKNI